MKFHLREAQNLPPIHTDEVQAAIMCQVIRYTEIPSDWKTMEIFHLLDGPCLHLAISNKHTTTGSRMAGNVNQHFYVELYTSKILVLSPLLRLANNVNNPIA